MSKWNPNPTYVVDDEDPADPCGYTEGHYLGKDLEWQTVECKRAKGHDWPHFGRLMTGHPPTESIQIRPPEVLDREWIAPSELSARTKLGRLARKLEEDDWEVRVGRSTFFSGDALVRSTGMVKEGKIGKHEWIDAVHRDTRRRLTATRDRVIVNGEEVEYE